MNSEIKRTEDPRYEEYFSQVIVKIKLQYIPFTCA